MSRCPEPNEGKRAVVHEGVFQGLKEHKARTSWQMLSLACADTGPIKLKHKQHLRCPALQWLTTTDCYLLTWPSIHIHHLLCCAARSSLAWWELKEAKAFVGQECKTGCCCACICRLGGTQLLLVLTHDQWHSGKDQRGATSWVRLAATCSGGEAAAATAVDLLHRTSLRSKLLEQMLGISCRARGKEWYMNGLIHWCRFPS
eukprot:1158700-Pelagomonas_calceolata.AAC.7